MKFVSNFGHQNIFTFLWKKEGGRCFEGKRCSNIKFSWQKKVIWMPYKTFLKVFGLKKMKINFVLNLFWWWRRTTDATVFNLWENDWYLKRSLTWSISSRKKKSSLLKKKWTIESTWFFVLTKTKTNTIKLFSPSFVSCTCLPPNCN